MPDSRKDQIADALSAMTGGESSPEVVEEESVLPPPDPTIFAPKQSTRQLISQHQLHTRRTMIPILLTLGAMLPIVGSLKWLLGPDSPFAAWEMWAPFTLAGIGLLLLILAVANMLQVRQLSSRRVRS